MKTQEERELEIIAQAIDDKKGMNIIVVNVSTISTFVDYFVIAEGTVTRHLNAIGDEIVEKMEKQCNVKPYKFEGKASGNWLAIDFGNIIVHLLTSEMRELYAIENVWKAGTLVDVPINRLPSKLALPEKIDDF